MQNVRLLGGLALAAMLAAPLTGCASGGSVRLDMVKMCQAHGGSWSQAQETCATSRAEGNQAAKPGKDICAYQGGTYLPGGSCIFPGR